MESNITTKFTIGNEQGINSLLFITKALAREKFSGQLPEQVLEDYINQNFNSDALIVDLNSMSNQYLIVYAGDQPAGYAKVTTKGPRPQLFDHKTAARIADFGILARYTDPLFGHSLFEKCLSVVTTQQVIWICEPESSPYLELFKNYGFKLSCDIAVPQDLPLSQVYLVREKSPGR